MDEADKDVTGKPKEEVPPPKPKLVIGQIVIYHPKHEEEGTEAPEDLPAIIQAIAEDGSCRLFVFGPASQPENLTEGEGHHHWSWPDF